MRSSNPNKPIISSLLLRLRLYSTSSSSTSHSPPKLKNICYRHRSRALQEARAALTDYLHLTRSLPFSVADHIASNSPFSLSLLLSQLPLDPSSPPPLSALPRLLRRHLSYRPVNEFEFFSESVGLPPLRSVPSPSPFLTDHPRLLPAVSALAGFGFPWTSLGLLCRHPAFLRQTAADLLARLRRFEALGFRRRVCVIGICLAFPWVLNGDGEDVDSLFRDLKTVFVDHGLDEWAGDDVKGVYAICRRIRVFYDAGSEKGAMGELMGRQKRVFLETGEEVLAQKLDFFLKLGMRKEEAGVFVLQRCQNLNLDLEGPGIAVPEYLISVGLGEEEAAKLADKYPYVVGKNKLGNLPGILRTVDLHRWFLDRVVNGGNLHYLTPEFASIELQAKSKIEDEFLEDIERIKLKKKEEHVDNKLEFLLNIGFGKNKITSKVLSAINGTKDQLRGRFDCLIEVGIEHDKLCRLISATPKLLNQSTELIHEKVNYLFNDLGYPLEYLYSFPAFLCFDLENRIKPRFKIMNWLKENSLLKKKFSPATVLANAEKRFIINLYGIHPAAPKQWLETFSSRSDHHGNQKNLFS